MKYGKIVAKRYKKQYFKKSTGWEEYDDWPTQPEQVHLILLELSSKKAIDAFMGNSSWTRRLPKKSSPTKGE